MGGGRLRGCANLEYGAVSSTDCSTRFTRGSDRREEHRSHSSGPASEILHLYHSGAIGNDRTAHRRSHGIRNKIFRIYRLVPLAIDLPYETAAPAEKIEGDGSLDARSFVFQRHRANADLA